jgi:hypothetical protein
MYALTCACRRASSSLPGERSVLQRRTATYVERWATELLREVCAAFGEMWREELWVAATTEQPVGPAGLLALASVESLELGSSTPSPSPSARRGSQLVRRITLRAWRAVRSSSNLRRVE